MFCIVEAGSNKQHAPSRNTSKLDQETEELRHDHVGHDVSRLIQQSRQQKGMTQKDLATVSIGIHFATFY